MFIKNSFSNESVVKKVSAKELESKLASPDIIEKLNKAAKASKAIAPKSDDFLYFTIIFMKAAEASLIDENGDTKKVGSEHAWGYFDDNFKWFGNVKPHKNSNSDIFPEVELKKAHRDWIGKPLCVDHKSDTVDGVRGIILDTHYDERLKQVVGLCALDKVNYPDLARKVETGVVRFGSMGTAVATSICADCGKKASNATEYCNCIVQRRSWGEINVGLRPIEYSLVVQPAEPGAILLRCIANVENHKEEISSYGLSVDSLPINSIPGLDLLLGKLCANNSCSVDERNKIIKAYFNYNSNNSMTKTASKQAYNKELLSDLARFEAVFGVKYSEDPELYKQFFGQSLDLNTKTKDGETFTAEQNSYNSPTLTSRDSNDTTDYSGTGSVGLLSSVTQPTINNLKTEGDVLNQHNLSSTANMKLRKILGDNIMNESKIKERAALRRRFAYHNNGSGSPEPTDYKNESSVNEKLRKEDKHMLQTDSLGGTDGVVPGDKEVKEKLSRAEELAAANKVAYHNNGTESGEPNTYKSESYDKYWSNDKHMHQTKSMGGTSGVVPGDEKIKEHLKRAKYNGPALSTRVIVKKALDGSINKEKSAFEVYSGDKLIIAATAKDIFGSKVDSKWNHFVSDSYSKSVIAHIRENGVGHTASLLMVNAQMAPEAAPAPAAAPEAAPAPAAPAEAPPMDDLGPMDMGSEDMGTEDSSDPKQVVDDALVELEDTIGKIKDAVEELGGSGPVDVNVNVGTEGEEAMPEDKLALSQLTLKELKRVYAEANEYADELAKIMQIMDSKNHTASTRRQLSALTRDALLDQAKTCGEAETLISMANTLSRSLRKVSSVYKEKVEAPRKVESAPARKPVTKTTKSLDMNDELVVKALELRKNRREELLKKAQDQMAEKAEEKEHEAKDAEMTEKKEHEAKDAEMPEKKEHEASDGVGMMENAGMAGVAKDSVTDMATKDPTGQNKAGPTGNADIKFPGEVKTPGREVAEAETSKVQAKLTETFVAKKSAQDTENYKDKLRRAYKVALDMQRRNMIDQTNMALDRQVDDLMSFDEPAFEAFKRTVANFKGGTVAKGSNDVTIEVGLKNNGEDTVKTASAKTSSGIDLKALDAYWSKGKGSVR